MRLRLSKQLRAEDRFEAWLAQRQQERLVGGGETAPGPCPDEPFLKLLAKKSRQIPLTDPRVSHVANCPICMRTLLELRETHQTRQRRLVLTLAIASCLLVTTAIFVLNHNSPNPQSQVANEVVIPQTVNLWDAGAFRGDQPGQLQSVSLPAALVNVTVILPRFSEPGRYVVAVTRDQRGNELLAQGEANATDNQSRKEVSVLLDLRKSKPGSYFLATTHEKDQASYYYPLQIK
jgi:hypothetical protein